MSRLCPESADGHGADPLGQLEEAWSGVEDDPVPEAVAEAISQPGEVSGGIAVGGGVGLDLEGEQVASAELGDDVDLVASVLLAQVVEAGSCFADRELAAELGDDEGVEQAPKEISVAEHGV